MPRQATETRKHNVLLGPSIRNAAARRDLLPKSKTTRGALQTSDDKCSCFLQMLHATFPNFPTTPVLQLLFVAFEHQIPLKPPSFTQPKQTFSMQFHQVFMISSLQCTVGDVPDSHQNYNLSTYWIDLGSSSFSLEIRTIAIISDWVLRPSWTNQRHQRTKYNRTRYGLRVWVYLRFDAASWTGMCNTNCSARFKVISIFLCRRMHTIQQPPWVLQQHCHQSKIVGNPTPRCEGLFLWMEEILHHLGWLKPNK